jgi:hypothetical protein
VEWLKVKALSSKPCTTKKKIGGFGDQMYVHASQVFYPAPIDSYVMQ